MSVQSNVVFALVLFYFALLLGRKVRTTFSTNETKNQNQPWLARTRFAALDANYLYLLQFLIGSFSLLFMLWLHGQSNYFCFRFTTLIWKPLSLMLLYWGITTSTRAFSTHPSKWMKSKHTATLRIEETTHTRSVYMRYPDRVRCGIAEN